MSALKAAPDAPSYYLRSKGEAEQLIREQSAALDWTIFKPSVMFGPGDTFLNRFAGLLAAIPCVFPLARPNARLQPVSVDDVVEAMRALPARRRLQPPDLSSSAARRSTRCARSSALVAKLTGQRRWIIGLPGLRRRTCRALFMDFVPGRPFSERQLPSLKVDSVCSEDGFAKLGIKPQSMAAAARQYLGSFEDNARLSHNRAAAGRGAQSGLTSLSGRALGSGLRSGSGPVADRAACTRSASG